MKKSIKNIYLDIEGRCGNQFFQYAFCKLLMKKIKGRFNLFINFNSVSDEVYSSPYWGDNLSFFNTNYKTLNTPGSSLLIKFASKKQTKINSLYKMLENKNYFHIPLLKIFIKYLMITNGLIKFDMTKKREFFMCRSRNIFVKGYFENPSIVNQVHEDLLNEFKPNYIDWDRIKNIYPKIMNKESICVSVRSWEEVENNIGQYKLRTGICTNIYYSKAMDIMHRLYPNSVFIIFTDNINFVKKHFNFKYKVCFEPEGNNIDLKLFLMYNCKHFILSNSTFAWWAQYLSRNNHKTVISPKIWNNNNTPCKLISDTWIKI